MGVKAFGARVTRFEDPALLSGRGCYVDDLAPPDVLHACFVRSPVAHARILSMDKSVAEAMPGVVAVLTAADLPAPMDRERIPNLMPNPSAAILRLQHALAIDEVCFVGEAVAVVVADSRYAAEDAAALVAVDYDPLPVAGDLVEALAADAPSTHSELADNRAGDFTFEHGDVDAAFAAAAHVVDATFNMHRGSGMPIEPRAVLARPDPLTGALTIWSSTQTPHLGRRILADLLGRDIESIRMIAPDVGGGFGLKAPFYPEEAVIPAAALMLDRPVKWCEDRRENFLAAAQERDQRWSLSMALDGEGRILGVRGTMVMDAGAFMPWGMVMPSIAAVTVPGPYQVPSYRLGIAVAANNRPPVAPVRGAGRPQAVFAMERLMDRAARTLGLDRAELRRRNLVPADAMPYHIGLVGQDGRPMTYHGGDFPASQMAATDAAGYGDFAERQIRAREEGRYIGIGIANYVEGTGLGPYEGATVRVLPSGKVMVASGAASQGQGTATTLAQVVSDRLGCAIEDVVVTLGDTDAIALGVGAFASRQAITAGSAAHMAGLAVREQTVTLAARVLGVDPADIDIEDGCVIACVGNRPSLTFGELARLAQGAPGATSPDGAGAGLEHTAYFHPPSYSYCNGTHVVEAEVDPMTGGVTLLRYTVAHDSGVIINPMIVDGQVQGGVAHGIGNALFERLAFDADGNPLVTTFQDYLLPTAPEVPSCAIVHIETPNPLNPIGVKGAGEGGAIPAPAAIVAAVEDALAPFGVWFDEMPLSPERIVAALREAGAYDKLG